jgi:hypothetical protein
MLDTLTRERFAAHVGDVFRMQVDASRAIDVELIAVEPSVRRPATEGHRAPFTIVFRAPRAAIYPQRTYRLEHATLGALDIFLVPIGFDDRGLRYEAVFS